MSTNIIFVIIITAIIAGILLYLISTQLKNLTKNLNKEIEQKLKDNMDFANKQFIQLALKELESQKKQINIDVYNKKTQIEDLVKRIKEELDKTNKKLETAEKDRIGSFNALKEELESYKKITEELKVTTNGLRNVLSNNQMRGQFGEERAEELLKMIGFVKGIDYEFNIAQDSNKKRPDFTIFLPDKTKINVDVKFPYSNLQRLVETDERDRKKEYLKLFEQDVKTKINQVASRDYINPIDKTVDFAIVFIPNEMVFSFIYDKLHSVWLEGMKKKVILTGPFSFTAILRMIKQSYDNFRYQENAQKIIKYISEFELQFGKYNSEFEKIGKYIEQVSKQYEKVNTTRTNQLLRTIDKVKSLESPSTLKKQDSLIGLKDVK